MSKKRKILILLCFGLTLVGFLLLQIARAQRTGEIYNPPPSIVKCRDTGSIPNEQMQFEYQKFRDFGCHFVIAVPVDEHSVNVFCAETLIGE